MTTISTLRWLGPLLLAALMTGCAAREESVHEQVPSFQDALNSQDAARITQWFTDDAALLPANLRRVSGREAILQYYKDLAAADLTYEVKDTGVMAGRQYSISEGTYQVRNTKTDTVVETGKYLTVLKSVDGQWRVHRLMTNTDVAPPKTTVTVDQPADVAAPKP